MAINQLSVEKQLEEIKKNPKLYLSIDNPSEVVSALAVSKNYELLKDVKVKTDVIIQSALKKSGNAIAYVTHPSEEQMMTAVKKTPTAFRYIEHPTEDVQLEAIRLSPSINFQYIKEPSYLICKEAVKVKGGLLRTVPKDFKTEEICLEAVKNDGKALRYVPMKLRTDEIIHAAIDQDYQALASVKKVSDEQAWLGVKQNVNALVYLNDLVSDDLYLGLAEYVVTHDEEGLQYVKNPSDLIIQKALDYSVKNVKHMPLGYWTKELLWKAVREQVFFETKDIDEALIDERLCLEMLKYSMDVLGKMEEMTGELTLTAIMEHGFYYRSIPNFPKEFKLMFLQRHGRHASSLDWLELNQKEKEVLARLKGIPSRSYDHRRNKVEWMERCPSYLFDFLSYEQDYRSTRLAVRMDPKLAVLSPYFVSTSEELDERTKQLYRSLT